MKYHLSKQDFNTTVEHVSHNTNCSNLKAQTLLDLKPKYTSIEATQEYLLDII